LDTNRNRSKFEGEYELVDTGVFNENRYFDVFVEHAKFEPEDMACRITVHNRGPEVATLHVMPTLWFRNTWSWPPHDNRPSISRIAGDRVVVRAVSDDLDAFYLYAEPGTSFLFCENETNNERLWESPNATRYVKDGINDYVVSGADTINPD